MNKEEMIRQSVNDIYYYGYEQMLNEKITYYGWEEIKQMLEDIRKILNIKK